MGLYGGIMQNMAVDYRGKGVETLRLYTLPEYYYCDKNVGNIYCRSHSGQQGNYPFNYGRSYEVEEGYESQGYNREGMIMRTTEPMQNPKAFMPHHIEPTEKLNTMRVEAHTTFNVNYHFVTIPKYRRHILMEKDFKRILSEIWVGQAESRGWQILAFEIQPDHIHLFVSVPPKFAPFYVIKTLKGNSSRQMRRIFPDLIRKYNLGSHLWAKGYFVSTAGYISEDTVKRYINEQEHHRLRDEWKRDHPKGKQGRLT